jgi:hypothetical protein
MANIAKVYKWVGVGCAKLLPVTKDVWRHED